MLNTENIMKIGYEITVGNGYRIEKIALYNKNRITEEEVKKAILLEDVEYNNDVVFMTMRQFQNVFGE